MAAPNEGALGKLETIGLAERQGTHWDGSDQGLWPLASLSWWVGAVPRTLPPSLPTRSSEALQRAQSVWPSVIQASRVGWLPELLPCRGASYLADKEVCVCTCVFVFLESQPVCAPGTEDHGPVSVFL